MMPTSAQQVITARPGVFQALRAPRRAVLVVLCSNVIWLVGLPVLLTEPPTAWGRAALVAVLLACGGLLVAVYWTAVTPWTEPRVQRRLWVVLVAAILLAWPACYAWAGPSDEPWAWPAGVVLGSVVLVAAWPGILAVAAVLGAAAVGGAIWTEQALGPNLLALFSTAAVTAFMGFAAVWLLRLLARAETARASEAEAAVTRERLRVARELHDVLGHRLGVIALKAEIAADLASSDPDRAGEESRAIQTIALETVTQARAALRGGTELDLYEQLDAATLVLSSAGIGVQVDVPPSPPSLPEPVSAALAAVVRESVTNILRHAEARTVTITFRPDVDRRILVIVNDGAEAPRGRIDGPRGSGGTGLPGLAARCAAVGVRLGWGPADDARFEIRAEVPAA
ncbi:sensor histidine kinase [Occultella gossypii]|uniref:Signal transduction histidine kinase subgroup 3 dimerisation and phosphoacceptor domain-containing protein n=1 Tax=Occultella gossypii TaxID=2800820 RepID=A0ABS7SDF3_9MICO|nr:histidine kinase [Occultella gossypii]MBZ2198200.1 hypothetical protein [Occultella gossypii]